MRKTRNANALLKDVAVSFIKTVVDLCQDSRYKGKLVEVEKDFFAYKKLFDETVDYTFHRYSSKFTFDYEILDILSSKMSKTIKKHYDKYTVEYTADKMADMFKTIIGAYFKEVEKKYMEQAQGVSK